MPVHKSSDRPNQTAEYPAACYPGEPARCPAEVESQSQPPLAIRLREFTAAAHQRTEASFGYIPAEHAILMFLASTSENLTYRAKASLLAHDLARVHAQLGELGRNATRFGAPYGVSLGTRWLATRRFLDGVVERHSLDEHTILHRAVEVFTWFGACLDDDP